MSNSKVWIIALVCLAILLTASYFWSKRLTSKEVVIEGPSPEEAERQAQEVMENMTPEQRQMYGAMREMAEEQHRQRAEWEEEHGN